MKINRLLFTVLLLFSATFLPKTLAAQERFTISGFVYEEGSLETLLGVNVYASGTTIGTVTNNYGFYSFTLPRGEWEIIYSFVGYKPQTYKVTLDKNIEFNVKLEASIELEEVEIVGTQSKVSSRSAHMSVVEIPSRQIKQIPTLLGEKDALKVIQLMPGVQKGSEGNSGLYVRGGGPDQNLIILDDAPVYNAYHLFGFFSLFNGDALKSIELTKGGFPARYGGRLSSVLDITMKDGNKQDFSGEAGVGIISSRLLLEGPIKKEKSSFLVSARRTYIDALTRPFMPSEIDGGYFFYDVNAKMNWEINSRNRVYLSGYFGKDKFFGRDMDDNYGFEAGMFWDNATSTIRWNSVITDQLFSNLSLIFSNYRLKIYAKDRFYDDEMELTYRSGIRDYGMKYDFSWHPLPSHTIRFGVSSTLHGFTPSAIVIKDTYFNEFKSEIETIKTVESGLYIEDEVKIYDKGIVNLGGRLSHFYHNKSTSLRFEPRISGSYYLTSDFSAKASYAQMNQHIHLLSSTGIGLPTDLWVPATDLIPSQKSWQGAVGLAKDIRKYSTTLSVEGYYKESENVISYLEGASFLMIDDPEGASEIRWEDNVASGRGWSYGVEFLAHRKSGKLSGWVGYTLSWTQLQFDELNQGEKFFARYDRRHDISVVGIYELNKNITLSSSWVYGTGNSISIPTSTYVGFYHNPTISGNTDHYDYDYVEDYGEKNSFRMAPYHRLDFGIQFHKITEKYERTWEVSVYNLYNRHNPFFYYIGWEEKWSQNQGYYYVNKLKQISLFLFIPSVSWSIKF